MVEILSNKKEPQTRQSTASADIQSAQVYVGYQMLRRNMKWPILHFGGKLIGIIDLDYSTT